MRRDLQIKSGNLAGTSDFRVLAPIKKGFVPSNEAVTYKTRVKRVLRTTHAGRAGGFEYELARVLSDSVERVGVIHSVGIAVLEPEDKVILTVTFDGAWEAYIRIIWQKVTRLLDLVFCNCEGYVLGYESTYEEWGIWLKKAQSEAYFLYATPALTVDDTRYLGMHERVYRREAGSDADLRVTRMRIPGAEDIARQSIFGTGAGSIGMDPTNAGFGVPLTKQAAGLAPFTHGVRSLVGLYRLADLYPPGTPDGEILHRAAQELLPEFRQMLGDGVYQTGIGRALRRFEEAVLWMLKAPADEPPARQDLPLEPPDVPEFDDKNVQGGILSPYPDGIDHGCLLLLAFESPAAVAALLSVLPFTSEADKDKLQDRITTNIAFTVEGLRAAGLTDDEVRELPEEFVQGMERRAGLLGDLRFNHPRRWRLPPLNWDRGENAADIGEGDDARRIDFSAVHAVIQVRLVSSSSNAASSKTQLMTALRKLIADSNDLLADGKKMIADVKGVTPLSLQWMQRQRNNGCVVEHFGFRDGASNPVLKKSEAGERYSNHVNLGEILCGHPNMADKSGGHAKAPKLIQDLLQDGSFLAVRKLRQDIAALDAALNAGQAQAADQGVKLTREELMAKMMGRWPDDGSPKAGQPLASGVNTKPDTNDFHFDADREGRTCPFHAHIRRANPRERNPEPGSRPPRFMRRGMSYGPPRPAGPDLERGLIFMAYNASLGEQYELVQRWLNGGNSSGSYSGQSDPIFGLAEPGRKRHFRFESQGKTVRVALDGSDRLHEEPRPFVRVEWGAYLFAPSRSALAILKARAETKYDTRPVTWSAETGDRRIADLRDIEKRLGAQEAITAWKAALEDPDAATDFTSASIWAAIREYHGGVLRTPYGVLVADRDMVQQVFADHKRLSIEGYLPRMRRSFGILYLGRDPGDDYEHDDYYRESKVCNDAIMGLDQHEIFIQARGKVHEVLDALVEQARTDATHDAQTSWDLTVDARELIDPLLALFCEKWFGLSQDDNLFRRAGYRWDWQPGLPPNYPGHFLSPSRYIFQPHPGPIVEKYGADHGLSVKKAMVEFLKRFGATITAPVTQEVYKSSISQGQPDLDFVARTVAGAMMGFIPTVEGSLRRILNEWLRDGNLWSLRARYDGTKAKDFTDACHRLGGDFIPAMQLRAVPELIWRTATVAHTLGTSPHQVDVQPGDIVVAGAVSATQQSLQEGSSDVYHAFGGNRRDPDHPTHACPGAHPALAVMIGFFSALVESRWRLRVGPGPLMLAADGRLPPPTEEFKRDVMGTISTGMNVGLKFGAGSVEDMKAAATSLVAIGDSWLFDQWKRDFGVERPNLIRSLLPLGYKDAASGTRDFVYAGRRLSDMAQPQFLTSVKNYVADEPGLKAILLSGGGNDVVSGLPGQQPLYRMLQQRTAGPPELNEQVVAKFIDGTLAGYYDKILSTLTASISIPILLHGYDHPIPDGRGDKILTVEIGPWIMPNFAGHPIGRGYDIRKFPEKTADLDLARDVVLRLIDRFNDMLARAAAAHRNVHYVKLTGRLAKAYGNDYSTHWNNELHPNEKGFDLLAQLIEAKLKSLKI